jgi:hypothetical protein
MAKVPPPAAVTLNALLVALVNPVAVAISV